MKTIFLLLAFQLSLSASAQWKMTAEEKSLRSQTDFTSFIETASQNNKKGCLCQENEYVVFSFLSASGKIASLCISGVVNEKRGYMVYRFGTLKKIELSFPSDTLNSFSKFRYSSFLRDGGRENAAMSLASVHFTNKGFHYELFDDWDSEDDQKHRGILVKEKASGKTFSIDAAGKVTGSLSVFRHQSFIAYQPRELDEE